MSSVIHGVCHFGQNEGEGEGSEKNIQPKVLYLDCTEIENKPIPDMPSTLDHGLFAPSIS